MQFTILTIFPDFFESPLSIGLVGKAKEKNLLQINLVNLRDYSPNKHNNVDDRPYGGSPGMVLCLDSLIPALAEIPPSKILVPSPKGKPLTQAYASKLAQESHITIVCSRYEGIDARLEDLVDVEYISVGDFVLNGAETAALCIIEAVGRLLPNFMNDAASCEDESFSNGLLEYPHYTRPENFQGVKVPEILLSGHHENINIWRKQESLKITLKNRPDLLKTASLEAEDFNFLKKLSRPKYSQNLFVSLVHYPIINKDKKIITTSLTNLDIHDIARACSSFELGGYFICTPLQDQQALGRKLIEYWQNSNENKNSDRTKALEIISIVSFLDEAITEITNKFGKKPIVIATSAQTGLKTYQEVQEILIDSPVLLVFGTGYGLADAVLEQADGILRPIRPLGTYNHLSVRSAVSIILDRIIGDIY